MLLVICLSHFALLFLKLMERDLRWVCVSRFAYVCLGYHGELNHVWKAILHSEMLILVSYLLYVLFFEAIKEFRMGYLFSIIPTENPPEDSRGRQKKMSEHYRVVINYLPPTTTVRNLEDMFKEIDLLGVKVRQNIVTGECSGLGHLYLKDINAVKAVNKKMRDLKLCGSIEKVNKAWSGFRGFLEWDRSESIGNYSVVCYGDGRSNFGKFCFKCGLPDHFAKECRTLNAKKYLLVNPG